ncbi:MAG: ABC transporter permease subunit [Candidatus Brocadiia bacterium]
MIATIRKLWYGLRERLPEVLLGFFLLSLLPLAVLLVLSLYRQAASFAAAPGDHARALLVDRWTVLAAVVFAAGVGLLIYLIARHWTNVWAVARKMIQEALHRRVIIVLVLFVLVLIPSLPFLLETEGNMVSQVQLVLLYSLCLALVLLSLVAIFLTTSSICGEVERKEVHITDTKPIRRWQFLMGKWLGVIVLCTAALSVMTGSALGLVLYLTRPVDYSQMTAEEIAQHRKEREELGEKVFIARRTVTIPPPPFTEEMEQDVKEWHARQKRAIAVHSYRESLLREHWRKQQTVPPGGRLWWRFTGLNADQEGNLQVRFKLFAHGAAGALGKFWPAELTAAQSEESGEKRLRPRYAGPSVNSPPGGWATNSVHEITIGGQYVDENGHFWLAFENWTRGAVTFDVEPPIEVLQKTGSFLPNIYRSLVVLVLHVALVAALGLMAGSLFSFPVASLLVFCFFLGGLMASWFHGEFVEPNIYAELTPVTIWLDRLWRGFAGAIIAIMPDFGRYSPLGRLVNGEVVGMGRVAVAGAMLMVVKGGVALGVGMFFYARRELARIIV